MRQFPTWLLMFLMGLGGWLGPAYAQDKDVPFKIDSKTFPSGTKIAINQIETTEFPKVKLFASVTRSGLPLGGLTAENFRVRENSVDQGPIRVSSQRDAISAVLLLDVSGSMKGAIDDVRIAATGFLKTLGVNDRVQVITFHEVIDTIYDLGNDFNAAEQAISKIRHRGDTALYDGVYAAIEAIRDVPGRRAVIILSDGVDDDGRGRQLSKRDLDEPLILGIQTNIPLYTIGLGSKMDAGILKTFAGTTGADYVNAPTKEELEELYAKIGQQLSNQYAIEYTTSKPLEGGLREVRLDFVIPSKKPYAAPKPVLDGAGEVVAYEAPVLTDDEINRLARMAGVGKFAKENKIKPLAKFIEELPDQWPSDIPLYKPAKGIRIDNEKEGKEAFSFKAPEASDNFMTNYIATLKQDDWSIGSQSKAGNLAFIKAFKGDSEITIGIHGMEEASEVNVEYSIPAKEPIVIEKNNANQIISAEGRDVIVKGTDGVIIVSGGCGKLTLSGEKNQVQCDTVQEVEVSGNSNVVILGAVSNGQISGSNNEVAWGRGFDGKEPTIKSTGSENKIMRIE